MNYPSKICLLYLYYIGQPPGFALFSHSYSSSPLSPLSDVWHGVSFFGWGRSFEIIIVVFGYFPAFSGLCHHSALTINILQQMPAISTSWGGILCRSNLYQHLTETSGIFIITCACSYWRLLIFTGNCRHFWRLLEFARDCPGICLIICAVICRIMAASAGDYRHLPKYVYWSTIEI